MDMAPPPEGGWTASLLLVTKFPVPGSSKTRLARGVGADAAASVAREMLRDLLHRLALDERLAAVHLILYFAPAERERDMRALIETLGETVQRRWDLVPMRPPEEEPAEQKTKTERLRSSDLGSLLANGLLQARERCGREPTLFIGMDTPHLDGGWLADALSDSRDEGCAVIHPSTDGGYVCLALPPSAPSIVFHNVRWSCEETFETQVAAIRAQGVDVSIGEAETDIDDEDDLRAWYIRACARQASLRERCPRTFQLAQALFPGRSRLRAPLLAVLVGVLAWLVWVATRRPDE
mmetsp:Transcript_38544/g.120677  ORF Transcript_38544/g.120677 Transcript_38544/m.120677 type:complete len:294 (-) Transcript_38544:1370-2251(-)